ncbi:MAG TPA: DUF4367 domain-containing protein [Candidatus Nitrosopolaris sp.]|nr:DUF4367 domain-containing protein [Candidatus Nitrosopolaris sp.]
MAKNTSIIELNGNKYDAVTGQLLGAVKRVAGQVKPVAGVIDGFVRKPVAAIAAKQPTPGRKVQKAGRRPQKSRTLMRGAVAKYAEARKTVPGLRLKARSDRPKAGQLLRAKVVGRTDRISRFGAAGNVMKSEALVGQVLPPAVARSSRGSSSASSAQAMPSLVASISPHRLERLLDEALLRADSHREMLKRQLAGNSPWGRIKLMPRWLSVGASLLVVLLLGGFFAWQNIPQVSMRVAASKAHISAAVPAYTPSGFRFAAPASNIAKAVTISYQAAGDSGQKYSISQQASSWDSSTLASSVNSQSDQVQTSQVNGTTVYIYGSDNNAAWVDNGILHTLKDQANLSVDQIKDIVGSM